MLANAEKEQMERASFPLEVLLKRIAVLDDVFVVGLFDCSRNFMDVGGGGDPTGNCQYMAAYSARIGQTTRDTNFLRLFFEYLKRKKNSFGEISFPQVLQGFISEKDEHGELTRSISVLTEDTFEIRLEPPRDD